MSKQLEATFHADSKGAAVLTCRQNWLGVFGATTDERWNAELYVWIWSDRFATLRRTAPGSTAWILTVEARPWHRHIRDDLAQIKRHNSAALAIVISPLPFKCGEDKHERKS